MASITPRILFLTILHFFSNLGILIFYILSLGIKMDISSSTNKWHGRELFDQAGPNANRQPTTHSSSHPTF